MNNVNLRKTIEFLSYIRINNENTLGKAFVINIKTTTVPSVGSPQDIGKNHVTFDKNQYGLVKKKNWKRFVIEANL